MSTATLPPALGFSLPARWTPLRPHPVQGRFWAERPQRAILLKGRQSGGTELVKRGAVLEAVGRACLLALSKGGHGLSDAELRRAIGETVALLLPGRPAGSISRAEVQTLLLDDYTAKLCQPTRDQAKENLWEDLKKLVPQSMWAKDPSESDLTITLRGGPRLKIVGMDKPARAEGGRNDLVILDEFADMRPEVLPATVLPAVSTVGRLGKVWIVGKSKLGRPHYEKLWKRALKNPGKPWHPYTWPSTDILTAEAIAELQAELDPLTYACEILVQWVSIEGRAYYTFDRAVHATIPLRPHYDPHAALYIDLDFNTAPGVAAIGQDIRAPDEWRKQLPKLKPVVKAWLDFVHIPTGSRTEFVCRAILAKHGTHKGEVRLYGDRTGGNRTTSQTEGTDWDQVRAFLGAVFKERLVICLPHKNPPERDRVNAMCWLFRAADGSIGALVDPECDPIIEDLESTQILKGSSGDLDKTKGKMDQWTHMTDAMGYEVHERFGVGDAMRWAEHAL